MMSVQTLNLAIVHMQYNMLSSYMVMAATWSLQDKTIDQVDLEILVIGYPFDLNPDDDNSGWWRSSEKNR